MTLADFSIFLNHIDQLFFELPDGTKVPAHFHITEVGQLDRYFLDCGGTVRKTSKVNFQMYVATDVEHRLSVEKLRGIIASSMDQLGLNPQLELQVEYQGRSIESYGLSYDQGVFKLRAQQTDCLAKEACGIPEPKVITPTQPACTPGSGCC